MEALTASAAVPPKAGIDHGLRYGILVALVAVVGILVYGTVATTRGAPPIPATVSTTLAHGHAAIVLWLVLNLIPVDVGQLVATIDHGYWFARSLGFYDDWTLFQWLRMPGDFAFAAGGLIVLYDLIRTLPFRRRATAGEEEPLVLPPTLAPEPEPPRELVTH